MKILKLDYAELFDTDGTDAHDAANSGFSQ
jgi:hypothetical protein